ncbi:hypothetical protein E2C01_100956 [Portunus trituberculatus]|uniref:Uncharacterized protein n=1 Tax=Portunus trituberculatus TaxID=210409 RepID=A0A5B7KKS9_PORTR|nr:hypothetical protein [Portunus trituberculatus]
MKTPTLPTSSSLTSHKNNNNLTTATTTTTTTTTVSKQQQQALLTKVVERSVTGRCTRRHHTNQPHTRASDLSNNYHHAQDQTAARSRGGSAFSPRPDCLNDSQRGQEEGAEQEYIVNNTIASCLRYSGLIEAFVKRLKGGGNVTRGKEQERNNKNNDK